MFQVNGFNFDHRKGELVLPTRSSRVYASPANPHIGAQVLPPQSKPSKLVLKRYDNPTAMAFNRDFQLQTIGQVVSIFTDGIYYNQLPYLLSWFVADVKLIRADQIAYASVSRTPNHYSPASRVITEWTIYAIPVE